MPIPKPRTGEKEGNFISRCIGFVKGEDPNMDAKQASAICYNQWRESKQMANIELKWNEKIEEFAQGEKSFLIKGVAISATETSNGHTFVDEELEKSAQSLVGRPLLKDHQNTVESIVGKVKSANFNQMTGSVDFEAIVIDKKMQEMINQGLLDSVSIGAAVREIEETEEGKMIPRGIQFKELSLVACPADDNATFTIAIQQAWKSKLEEAREKAISQSRNSERQVKGGDEMMAEEQEAKEEPQEEKQEETQEEPQEEAQEAKEEPKEEAEAEPQEDPQKAEEKQRLLIREEMKKVLKEQEAEEPKEEEDSDEEEDSEDVSEGFALKETYGSRGHALTVVRAKY